MPVIAAQPYDYEFPTGRLALVVIDVQRGLFEPQPPPADADAVIARINALADKARLQPQYLEQVATVGNGVRDPRGWSLSTFYLALLPADTVLPGEDWCFASLTQVLDEGFPLPFDHVQLVAQARERLASKSVYTSLPLYLLAPRFTVTEALLAFQACLGQAIQHTTLRGRLEKMKQQGWISDTGEKNYPKMGRPQMLLQHRPQAGAVFIFRVSSRPPEVN